MYKAVAQSFSLYGSESWVLTGGTIKALTSFHHQAARRIMGMTAKRGAGGERYYSAVEEEMDYAGIQPIGVYIKSRHTTIAGMLACRPVYALCMEAERIPGMSRMVQW